MTDPSNDCLENDGDGGQGGQLHNATKCMHILEKTNSTYVLDEMGSKFLLYQSCCNSGSLINQKRKHFRCSVPSHLETLQASHLSSRKQGERMNSHGIMCFRQTAEITVFSRREWRTSSQQMY